ncbi:hypothetical protein F7725_001561 [Dissostichus mawsoni]|uniref:Peptidase S9 prolyl oligopeptidase catalytic domain-containing protein n=1 Tax=Dissostichus mawsoni TaxID=36200 RepID=A0A7J5XZZ9_DISMA|nr:hypothetical protein F7725_001561 [Dissostichus mawsoni]
MFTEDGMRICKAKSTLKKSLQVEVSRRNAGDEDVTVIDGSALLWTIHWPADGTVADFIDNVKTRLISYLSESDVYLIFDGYYDYSIKSVTRDVWETVVNRKHHLLLSTKLPAQKVVLSSIENKKQLNLLLFKELTEDRLFHLRGTNKHKGGLMPHRDQDGRKKEPNELENQQEEADTIIVQQVLACAREAHQISVVSDDTDVFVLLLHHYHQAGLDVTHHGIPQQGKSNSGHQGDTVQNLLPAHAISGCDTVSSYYGLGKGSVIKVLKAGYEVSAIGNIDAPFQQVLDPATAFISACYGIKENTDMSHTRILVWGERMEKDICLLQTLLLYHQQMKPSLRMLRGPLSGNVVVKSQSLNPEEFGWKKDTCNRSLIPTHLPEDAKRVPDYILEMIRCGCKINPLNIFRHLVRLPYIDRNRVGAYGGYLSSLLLLSHSSMFQCGIAVAPITNWRLYGISDLLTV